MEAYRDLFLKALFFIPNEYLPAHCWAAVVQPGAAAQDGGKPRARAYCCGKCAYLDAYPAMRTVVKVRLAC